MWSIVDDSPIALPSGLEVGMPALLAAVEAVNLSLSRVARNTSQMAINLFEVLDFRVLSGLVGEFLVAELASLEQSLLKNPNIDGYPDLLDVSRPIYLEDVAAWIDHDRAQFIAYRHGGIEVKNTFGVKRPGEDLLQGERRIGQILDALDWKAHHTETNFLLATFSDFVDGAPQIVAAMYSDSLSETDWRAKSNPSPGSTMTSFSVIAASGRNKLMAGLRICADDPIYKAFFGIGQ